MRGYTVFLLPKWSANYGHKHHNLKKLKIWSQIQLIEKIKLEKSGKG